MVHPLENGFSTPAMAEVFSAPETVAAIISFEAELALALVDAGLAPSEEASEVAAACREPVDDPEGILASVWDSGTPLIALREVVATRIDESALRWFHHGATTQDAIDTGHMIQAKKALGVLDESLTQVTRTLRGLVTEYREQPQMGRTFLQYARPTTFGFRAAQWLDAVLTNIDDLRHERENLRLQLGGSVGTMASYGLAATEVLLSLARRLDLQPPNIAWHSDRSSVHALAEAVARSAQTMAKIAGDIVLLAQSDVAEVKVRPGRSSSMPEKRNPIDAIRARAAAGACHGFAAMLTSAPPPELDRGIGGWHLEGFALPRVFTSAGAAVEAIGLCLESLTVNTTRMAAPVTGEDLKTLQAVDPRQIDRVLTRFNKTVM
ncbi:MAG: 3-carboxy-cis,cis-muconate cycloisomerase [Acidimicrobiia bacterium]|nr:3-carboxy-cis,cis-muconate cycloisomerase [Acidimicrobiia bacterium]